MTADLCYASDLVALATADDTFRHDFARRDSGNIVAICHGSEDDVSIRDDADEPIVLTYRNGTDILFPHRVRSASPIAAANLSKGCTRIGSMRGHFHFRTLDDVGNTLAGPDQDLAVPVKGGMNYSRAELCSAAQYFDARLKEPEQDYEWVIRELRQQAATQCGHRAGVSARILLIATVIGFATRLLAQF